MVVVGTIKTLTLDEIKKYDAGSWFSEDFKGEKVPRLEPYLNEFKVKIKLARYLQLPS